MLALILKISIAHILGDFVFQSDKMVADIHQKKLKSFYLYFHALIHFGLILVLTGFQSPYILPALILALSHLLIDILTKIFLQNSIGSISNFILDQLLHIIAIALFVRYFFDFNIDYAIVFSERNYLLLACLLLVSFVSSIMIKKVMEMFNYPLPNDGLKDAGKYIGILERLFVFIFVITSFWEGIGFLLAAKSIFRFGDLKENKEIRLTEYILIGSLISFGVAMLIGLLYLRLESLI